MSFSSPLCLGTTWHFNISRGFEFRSIRDWPAFLAFDWVQAVSVCPLEVLNCVAVCNVLIQRVCLELDIGYCMATWQARQLPISARASHFVKVNWEPMILMLHPKFVCSITYDMAIGRHFYVCVQLFHYVWTNSTHQPI